MLRAANTALTDYALLNNRCFYNFKPSNTRHLRLGLARVRAGTGRLTLACTGDSTTSGTGANTGTSGQVGAYPYTWPAQLKTLLNSKLAAAVNSSVWGMINGGIIAYGTYDTRVSLGAGWDNGAGCIGTMWHNNSDTSAFSFTSADNIDTAIVWYTKGTGNGTFTIDVDGGSALATIDSSGTSAFTSTTVTFTRGTHTINIQRTGTGADIYIAGIYAYDSTTPAIDCWNWGWHGTKATTWSLTASPWSTCNAIASIAPNVLIYGLGINDQDVTDVATFKTSVQAVVTSAKIAGDVIIAIPDPVNTAANSQANQDAIRNALYDLAATNDLPVIDRTLMLESYTQANTNGLVYDSNHLNKLGYAEVASLVAKALTSTVG